MSEIACDLTDDEYALIARVARERGVGIDELAAMATSMEIASRYKPPEIVGNVVPFEALKRRLRGPPQI